jgi:hypothetical protein
MTGLKDIEFLRVKWINLASFSTPPYVVMVWCLINQAQAQFYLTIFLFITTELWTAITNLPRQRGTKIHRTHRQQYLLRTI